MGHMLITTVAQQHLTPATRAKVDQAITRFNFQEKPDSGYDFVSAACWMDDARSKTKDFNAWHYVNLPFTREGTPVPEGSESDPNVIWGIEECIETLKGKPGVTDRDKALVILLHLVGDAHQPLHTADRDDLGGNRQPVTNLRDPETDLLFSKGGNLHFFWDMAYRRVFENGEATVAYFAPLYPRHAPVAGHKGAEALVAKDAAALLTEFPLASFEGRLGGTPTDWALESHAVGVDLAYGQLPGNPEPMVPVALDEDYVDKARACARERLVLGGLRLANLLNSLFDPGFAPAR